jgi:hypothetical protein
MFTSTGASPSHELSDNENGFVNVASYASGVFAWAVAR